MKKNDVIFWAAVILLSVSFFAIPDLSEKTIHHLYHQDNFELLNFLSANSTIQGLPFYLEKTEDTLWGPLKSLLSGIALLLLCLRYFSKSSLSQFSIVIFLYLLITKHEVLTLPPYGDAIYGPFSDAVWLARHSLNYIEFHRQPTFTSGGPLIYPFSIYPFFLAVLIKITPSPVSFLVTIHTIVFLISAVIIATFRAICRSIMPEKEATVSSLLLLSMPLFQSMSEAINLEMPCLFFAMLTAYFILRQRFLWAGLMSILSLLVKDPGIISCGILFFSVLLWSCVETSWKGRIKLILWGIGIVMLALLKGLGRQLLIGGEQVSYNKVTFLIGWMNLRIFPAFWISLAALPILTVILLIRQRKLRGTFKEFITRELPILIMFGMVVLYLGLYLNFSALSPRYRLLLTPFFLFSLLFISFFVLKKTKIFLPLLSLIILCSFICSHGLIYDRSFKHRIDSHVWLERSLEYRNDLKLFMKTAKKLEEDFSQWTIGAPLIFAHILNFHEMGYVTKNFDIVVYGMKPGHEGLREFEGLKSLNILKTIWIGTYNERIAENVEYPISSQDKIVEEVAVADKRIVLFMGGFAIEKVRQMIEWHQRQLMMQQYSKDHEK